jgi:hypothetical protein
MDAAGRLNMRCAPTEKIARQQDSAPLQVKERAHAITP